MYRAVLTRLGVLFAGEHASLCLFAAACAVLCVGVTSRLSAADCNLNGIDDALEIASGGVPDCNGNGVPDSCDLTTQYQAPPLRLSVAIGSQPDFMTVADLDLDGWPDLVVGSVTMDRVRVFHGTGPQQFVAGPDFAAGADLRELVVACLDADPFPDLLVMDRSAGLLRRYSGDGMGGFGPALPFALGFQPGGMVVGDLDGDGDQDLAVTDPAAGFVRVGLNDGAGNFIAILPVFGLGSVSLVATGDQDGDGDLDLVVASPAAQSVQLLRNNGSAGFSVTPAVATGMSLLDLRLVELTGDVLLDVIGVGTFPQSALLVVPGTATGLGLATLTPDPHTSSALATIDFDLDGDLDVATAERGLNVVALWQNDGAGQLDQAGLLVVGSNPRSLAVADLDLDGLDDLLAVNRSSNDFTVLLQDPAGHLRGVPVIPVGVNAKVILTPLDGDALDDVIALGADGRLGVWLATGTGFIASHAQTFLHGARLMAVDDHDGDGLVEIMIWNPLTASIEAWRWEAATGLTLLATVVSLNQLPQVLLIGQLDGQGGPDLVIAAETHVFVALSGGMGPTPPVPTNYLPGIVDGFLFDLEPDGDLDVILIGVGSWVALRNDGSGMFPNLIGGGISVAFGWRTLIGDINGDGTPDLLSGSHFFPFHLVLGFPHSVVFTLPAARERASAELTGDLYADVVGIDSSSHQLSVVEGNSTGPGGSQVVFPVRAETRTPLLARFGGDPLTYDLAISDSDGRLSWVIDFSEPASSSDCNGNGIPDECDLASGSFPDCNGDGLIDECTDPPLFRRADCNTDGVVDLSDVIKILQLVFTPAASSPCQLACDANSDPGVNIADAVYLLGYLFTAPGVQPNVIFAPFPDCGLDPLPSLLPCSYYPPCGPC